MSKRLDIILDNYVNKKTNEESGLNDDTNREDILESAKNQIRREIYNEISAEIRDRAIEEAEDRIEQRVANKRIREYKKLAIEGFVLAFFVGLLVNQLTEITGFYKGSIALENILGTIVISFVLFAICGLVFIYIFLKTLLSMWKEVKKNETN